MDNSNSLTVELKSFYIVIFLVGQDVLNSTEVLKPLTTCDGNKSLVREQNNFQH